MFEQTLVRRRALKDRPVGRDVAEQREQATRTLKRVVHGADDRTIDETGSVLQALSKGFPGDGSTVEIEVRLQLVQHRPNAAGRVEILHVVLACRLEIDQHRRRLAHLIQVVEVD